MKLRYSAIAILVFLGLSLTAACSSSDGESGGDGDSDGAPDGDQSGDEDTASDGDEPESDSDGMDGDTSEVDAEEGADGDPDNADEDTLPDGDEDELDSEPEEEAEPEAEPEAEEEFEAEAEIELEPEDEIEPEAEEDELLPWFIPTAPLGLLVVNDNGLDAGSLSLIDISDGSVAAEAFVGSGDDLSPALSLSRNLLVPSYPLPDNRAGVLDSANAAYTAFSLSRSYSVWQRNLQYNLSPQDIIVLSDGRAYVTRYEPNPDDNPGIEWDSGDDVYIVSWPDAAPLGGIELGSYASNVGGVQCRAHPRRMAAAWNLIWVVLENSSADGNKAGDGKIVAIDPADDSVVYVHTITGRHNCSDLAYMPALDMLAVVCGGNPGDANPKNYSGVFGYTWNGSSLATGFSKTAEFIGIGPLGPRLEVYNEWTFVVVRPVSGVNYGETLWGVNGSNLGTISIYQTPQNGLIKSMAVEAVRGRIYFTSSASGLLHQADLKKFPFEELSDQRIDPDSTAAMNPVEIGLY